MSKRAGAVRRRGMTTTRASATPTTHAQVVAGRIITAFVGVFLAFDAVIHLARESHAVEFTAKIGAPNWLTLVCGVVMTICLITYFVPRTSTLGAVLLTGYFGGAIATNLATGQPLGNSAFALATGVAVWAGLWPRDARVRAFFR
jgi:hypothetical protein